MKEPIDLLNICGPLTLESLCTTYILENVLLHNGNRIENCAKMLLQSNIKDDEELSLKPRKRRSKGF